MVIDWDSHIALGSLADWVAAVGTVGALFWALWLARSDRRDRKRREYSVAQSAALSMHKSLTYWLSIYRMLEAKLNPPSDDSATFIILEDVVFSLNTTVLISKDDIHDLIFWNNEVSAKISHRYNGMITLMDELIPLYVREIERGEVANKDKRITQMLGLVRVSIIDLESVIDKMEELTNIRLDEINPPRA